MMTLSPVRLVHLGDATLLIPVAAAIALFLALNRAWRLSLRWTVSFGAGLTLVIVSKIAFIGWGFGIEALDYKAVSGHAMLTAAVLPTMFHIILWKQRNTMRHAGVAVGFAMAALVSGLLVRFGFHSWAEAIAGSALGASISVPFLRAAAVACQSVRVRPWTITASATMLLLMQHVTALPVQTWMTDTAAVLSGHEMPYSRRTRTD
jgi:hypothetical protein